MRERLQVGTDTRSTRRILDPFRALLNCVLNVKAVVAAFNQEKALVGALSVIVQLHQLFVCSTNHHTIPCYTSYWGTIIVTILTPACVLTSAAPAVPARCGDYIALEHLSLALIGTH